jgi:glycosyltransferase involved in cell wall biosynthesis
MTPLHVVVDTRTLPWSGIGRYLSENLRRLVGDTRFRFTLLGDPQAIRDAGIATMGRVAIRPWRIPVFSPTEQVEFPRIVPPCDVFWGGHFNMPLLRVRAKRRAVTIYDLQPLAQPDERGLPKRIYARLLYGCAARSDAIFTISDFSAGAIRTYLRAPAERIHRIYCGVDPSFPEGAAPGRRLEAPYVLFVGNVKPHKNLHGALAGFFSLPDRYAELRFVIVGRREGFHTPDRRIERLITGHENRVIFAGRVTDSELKAWYRDATLFLFPSRYEGFGLPILEAPSFGLPVVSSRSASLPEVGGDVVRYAETQDAESICRALVAALDAGRPSPDAVRRHLACFSWDRSAAAHADVLYALGATTMPGR